MAYDPKIKSEGKTKLENLDQNVKIVTWALIVIVGGIIFTLGGILSDKYAQKQAAYEDLRDQVLEQNFKMDYLIREFQNLDQLKK